LFLIIVLTQPSYSRSIHQRWIVTPADNASPAQLAQQLLAEGFVVGQVLEAVGINTGQASAGTTEAWNSLPGLASIEPCAQTKRTFFIGNQILLQSANNSEFL
jgi:hypothetical protein